jgi:hypothetical protein
MIDNPPRAPRILIIENDFLIGEMLHDMVAELDDQKHGNDIADILLAKNIPFAFVTGYGHAFEQRHAGIPLLKKPFTSGQLRVLLGTIVGPGGSPNHSTSHAA